MNNDGISHLTRRKFLISGSAVVLRGSAALRARSQSTTSYVEVETRYGRVRGVQGSGLVMFKGIPYGGSVSGVNRFKAAPPLKPWTGVRDALEFGPPALQQNNRTRPNLSEDCLVLNIWTPAADGHKRPVMFYNHGGGFVTGSAAAPYQDGGNLARTWDVVVVATNHRLGLMGYLYLGDLGGEEYATSGNQGLEDIRDGMKWVHENIERFGGDPNNVMIFGESGGGAKTSCLYAMPSAASYFNKASIESGPGIRIMPRETAASTAIMLLKQLGLDRSDWRKLLEIPAEKLIDAQLALGQNRSAGPLTPGGGRRGMSGNANPGGFGPVLDGHLMPTHPFDPIAPAISKSKPLMVGYNRDEMNFFIAQNGAAEIYALTEDTLKARLEREYGVERGADFRGLPKKPARRVARRAVRRDRHRTVRRDRLDDDCRAEGGAVRRTGIRVLLHSRITAAASRHTTHLWRGSCGGDRLQVQQCSVAEWSSARPVIFCRRGVRRFREGQHPSRT